MRRLSVVPVVLAACLTATIALAARETATANFESLSASGVQGEATLRAMPANGAQVGGTQIHGSLTGLQPGVEYVVQLFTGSQNCASGTPSALVVRVTANPAGQAVFNQKVDTELATIGSLGVQKVSDQSWQACAAIAP